ncbi:MAG TPA: GNAT family N-acetyltransferase [Pyrinomonadaceae bacterium]
MNDKNGIRIRLARVSDARVLADLRYALRSADGRSIEAENDFVRRCVPWMTDNLPMESWRCWVAENQVRVIGNIWLQRVEKLPNPTTELEYFGYITNFFVVEAERGSGIGSLLLSTALSWCREHDFHAVILWPTEKSRSLYERHGFAIRSDLLELVIQHAESPFSHL